MTRLSKLLPLLLLAMWALPAGAAPSCGNQDVLGTSRTLAVPAGTFGTLSGYPALELEDHEVALTFDDGPAPVMTPAVLTALHDQCVQATFFMIGRHVDAQPDIARAVLADGHTIGLHSWSHLRMDEQADAAQIADFNRGLASLHKVLGNVQIGFYRFPELRDTPALLQESAQRKMAVLSADISSDDWKGLSPTAIVTATMARLHRHGGGIIGLHDARENTALALPLLLAALKTQGYKIVQLVPAQ